MNGIDAQPEDEQAPELPKLTDALHRSLPTVVVPPHVDEAILARVRLICFLKPGRAKRGPTQLPLAARTGKKNPKPEL